MRTHEWIVFLCPDPRCKERVHAFRDDDYPRYVHAKLQISASASIPFLRVWCTEEEEKFVIQAKKDALLLQNNKEG